MAEARGIKYPGSTGLAIAVGALLKGDVFQLPDGRAAVVPDDLDNGTPFVPQVDGSRLFTKASGLTFFDGAEAWFDYSARTVTYRPVNDRDFYLGTVVGDTPAAAGNILVNVNNRQRHKLDLVGRPHVTAIIKTAGAPNLLYRGCLNLTLDSTNEAQKVDALSKDSFAPGTPAIVDLIFAVTNGSSGGAPDVNLGLASATHNTDFDSIGQHLAVHFDGNSTAVKIQSKDGTNTTPATATTPGTTYTAGATNRIYVTFDMRTPSNVKILVNGVLVAVGSSPVDVSAAASDWKAIAHAEKTAAADTLEVDIERLTVRIME